MELPYESLRTQPVQVYQFVQDFLLHFAQMRSTSIAQPQAHHRQAQLNLPVRDVFFRAQEACASRLGYTVL
ncbi:Uncharacterised protein [Chlamydia trachomatis]|nr:Uncharacterised protein [Chlamydia trachomatis]